MAFADLFSTPTKTVTNSGGWGGLFANLPSAQLAQKQKDEKIATNAQAAKTAVASVPSSLSVSSLINAAGNVFGGAIKAGVTPIVDMAKSSFGQATNALTDSATGKSTTGGLKEGLDLVAGIGGVAFSPIAGLINPVSQLIQGATNVAGNLTHTTLPDVAQKLGVMTPEQRLKYDKENGVSDNETTTKILSTLQSAGGAAMALLGAQGGEATPKVPFAEAFKEPNIVEPVVETQTPKVKMTEPPVTAPQSVKSTMVDARTTKAASDINSHLVEAGFKELPIEEQATYTPSTKAAQLEAVGKIMNNPAEAIAMAKGEKALPDGVHAPVLFNAVVKHAVETNDYELQRTLAQSPLAEGSSIHGQQLGAENFNPVEHSPVKIIRDVQKMRQKAVEPKIRAEIPKIKNAIRKNNTKQTWGDFAKSVIPEC